MKVVGYCALHYGLDYLEYAIKSVIDYVDDFWVLYSPVGSHGHHADRPCPEREKDLYRAAARAAGHKLHWHSGAWPYEGAQRETIHQVAPDADVILVVDADEIWPADTVEKMLSHYEPHAPIHETYRYRLPMIHFWRSFYRAILHDPALPERVIVTKGRIDYTGFDNPRPICHMGYAQSPKIVEYKQLTHGHRSEWRRDDWFNRVFMANVQVNTHPVGSDYWNPEDVNPWDYLPDFMRQHPYADMAVIE